MAESSRVEELRKRYHENPRRFFAPLANEYRKSGLLDRAILLCQKHLSDQPGNMNGLIVYGQALFETGRHEEARDPFGAALELDPENLIALRHLGDIARLSDDRQEAQKWYGRVLEFDRRNDEVRELFEQVGGSAGEPASAKTVEVTPRAVPSPVPAATAAAAGTPRGPRRASLLDINFDFGETAPAAPVSAKTPVPASAKTPTPASASLYATDADFPLLDSAVDEGDFTDLGESLLDLPPETAAPRDIVPVAGLVVPHSTADVRPLPDLEPAEFRVPAIVTETMADLYLEQGFRSEGIDVYRTLLEQDPHDERLKHKLAALEAPRISLEFDVSSDAVEDVTSRPLANAMLSEVSFDDLSLSTPAAASVAPEPVSVGPSAREFLAAFARRTVAPAAPPPHSWAVPAAASSLDDLFGGAVADVDQRAANHLAGVGTITAPSGGSNFDTLFTIGAPEALDTSESSAVPRASEKLQFDQFFSATSSPPPSSPAMSNPAPTAQDHGDDLDRFHGWLKGLTE